MSMELEYEDAALVEDEKARIAVLHKSAPEVIWLQVDPEAEQFDGWDAQTWCTDKINDSDVKYVRADDATLARIAELERENDLLKAELKAISEALDDPRTDLTMTMAEVITDLRTTMQQVLADAQAQDVLPEWWPMMERAIAKIKEAS